MINQPSDERLIVFVRLPEKGRVKTRLARKIGDDDAAAFYGACVSDILATARKAGYPPLVCFHPPDAREDVAAWLGDDITCLPQAGADLGQRMFSALAQALSGCARAVLIGSDFPDIPSVLLKEAFEGLRTRDVVIGPAADGGYYLIGFRPATLIDAPFSGVEWGAPGVFDATIAALKRHGLGVHVLPVWRDIDVYDDLLAFRERNEGMPSGVLASLDFVRERLGKP